VLHSVAARVLGTHSACLSVHLKRLRLPTGSVQGKDELPAKVLAQGMVGDQCFDFSGQVGVAAGFQIGVDTSLERAQAKLVEACDLPPQRGL
jgi:hypothetical protein